MAYDCKGRTAKSLEEAECYIRHFMLETMIHSGERWVGKSFDYDLFIPRLMEIVENSQLPTDVPPTPTPELERLYMEAAWDLCQRGLLRPGPRKANFDNARDAYGKGYSLTFKGEAWLREIAPELAGSAA